MSVKKKIIVIMPAFNAEATLERTVRDIQNGIVDEIILVDDCSNDRTVEIAERLDLTVIKHNENKGYGANQKTCYDEAIKRKPDSVVMIHPDYQYDPRIIPYALGFIEADICDIVIGSRIRDRKEALKGGMPLYKYFSNRFLTIIENIAFGQNLGDFHSGFRVFKRKVLERISYHNNSNDFVFDTQVLAQAAYYGFRIGDVPIPARYFPEASSISYIKSIKYGLETLGVVCKYLLQKFHLYKFELFEERNLKFSEEVKSKISTIQ
jgi:glycosyltransferase involved in cell wall biosynthesis|tara:strand:- start:2240 stop:3034 length:795 start_codon:yes stop_codon:yes gene_type:complete